MGYVEALAEKYYASRIDVAAVDVLADDLLLGALADEQEIDVALLGEHLGGSVDENIVTLHRTKVGNGDDQKGVRWKVELMTKGGQLVGGRFFTRRGQAGQGILDEFDARGGNVRDTHKGLDLGATDRYKGVGDGAQESIVPFKSWFSGRGV